MSERKFSIGDRVDTSRWDRTMRPSERSNGGVVVRVREANSESGWMITFEDDAGRKLSLDQNWLKEVPHGGE